MNREKQKNIRIRLALPSDIESIFDVRTSVKENYLSREEMELMGVTESVVTNMIEKSHCAWVAIDDEKVIGFSMILPDEGCLFAAFVLPEYEGRGVGRSLVELAEQELFKYHEVAWLETDKNSRAAEFYRRLGWVEKENVSESDIRLEKFRCV
ncbi:MULTISPECIES: GNAT family N-acetyltransferase [unclassified Pantoea]|uniref:GNAT family N-acetyltransferase n=1 Tax=unclassified Pantoea TaxID=2630326 RepID=UPI002477B4CD|nr:MULTISPECIES: GNAT family N-acetyltransferase [unclassified Pantoea]GME45959.1 GNAT family N-acetyltransferase [Pantoea sp. QMID1]GME46090.1 GNAT family N-acetyltransferase [Pantoea sp. QMID3]GME61340.1 GNAT family N-acetyltransferase [Pantoea sp. QMID4]GME62441.1 GNAT family N-acetyltransferase [Pantoea sp. QMID2]